MTESGVSGEDAVALPANDEPSVVLTQLKQILAEAAEQKLQFDDTIASAANSIDGSVADAKSRASEIEAFKADVTTIKTTIEVEATRARAIASEIETLKTDVATVKSALDTEATKARASATEIETLKTNVATTKGGMDEIQRSATADVAMISQQKQNIETLNSDAAALSKKVNADYEEVTKNIASLQERQTALKVILDEVQSIKVEAKKTSDSVSDDVRAIAAAKTTFESLTPQTQTAHDALTAKQAEALGLATEIVRLNEEIKVIHAELFTDTPAKKALKNEVSDLHATIKDVLQSTKQQRDQSKAEHDKLTLQTVDDFSKLHTNESGKFSELYDTLQNQILSLLPSAGSAGLASTYYDAKARYAVTAFHSLVGKDGTRESATRFRKLLGHDPTSLIATIVFYFLFLGPLVAIIWFFFDILQKMAAGTLFSTQYLVFRALIALPLGTVSVFGYSSLRLYRRLYEEYNYKQRVEIQNTGSEDQKKALLAIMLKAVADKPSVNMHRYDGIATDGGFKIDLSALLARFFVIAHPPAAS